MANESLPFLSCDGPYIHTFHAPQEQCDDLAIRLRFLQPPVWTAVARGERMVTTKDVLMETATALQFPLYFGRNYNALWDCVLDLCWVDWKQLVFIIGEAEKAFAETPIQDKLDYLEYLAQAAGHASQGSPEVRNLYEGIPRSFHIVVHSANEEAISKLRGDLASKGLVVGTITIEHLDELLRRVRIQYPVE